VVLCYILLYCCIVSCNAVTSCDSDCSGLQILLYSFWWLSVGHLQDGRWLQCNRNFIVAYCIACVVLSVLLYCIAVKIAIALANAISIVIVVYCLVLCRIASHVSSYCIVSSNDAITIAIATARPMRHIMIQDNTRHHKTIQCNAIHHSTIKYNTKQCNYNRKSTRIFATDTIAQCNLRSYDCIMQYYTIRIGIGIWNTTT